MKHRTLGRSGPPVSALGLGCMGMSDFYGSTDRSESIATVHAALDAGVTLLDTGDFYGMGDNELLLGEALGALDVTLDAHDLAAIERAVPPDAAAGDRYAAAQMAMLDSER